MLHKWFMDTSRNLSIRDLGYSRVEWEDLGGKGTLKGKVMTEQCGD